MSGDSNDFSSFVGFLGKLFTFQDPFEEAAGLFRSTESEAAKQLTKFDKDITDITVAGKHLFPSHPLEKIADVVYNDVIAGQWAWFKYILESTFVTIAVILGVLFLLWLLG